MRNHQKIGYLYALPAVLFFLIFVAYPVLFNIYTGFTSCSGIGEATWVGFENYKEIFSDPTFYIVLKNFVIVTGLFVVLDCVLGLILAVFVKMKLKLSNVAKVIIYTPLVISPIIIGYTFKNLLEYNFGLVNTLLKKIGLESLAKQWLIDPKLVLYVLVAILLWQGVGFAMTLYTAGISAIPREVYEAAELDGAGEWKKFRHITVPMVRGTTYTLVIMNVITYIKLFDIVWVMTKGGPGKLTNTFTIFVYEKAFKLYDQGSASAVATIMLILSLVLTVVQLKMYNKGRDET